MEINCGFEHEVFTKATVDVGFLQPGYGVTEDPSCQTPEPYRGRMRLLQLFPPIAGQEEAAGEGQSFHEHEGLAGIAAVIHKVWFVTSYCTLLLNAVCHNLL